jgi:hypothetical protein
MATTIRLSPGAWELAPLWILAYVVAHPTQSSNLMSRRAICSLVVIDLTKGISVLSNTASAKKLVMLGSGPHANRCLTCFPEKRALKYERTYMDFIERWFGISPDAGNGVTEVSYIVLVLALAVLLFRRLTSPSSGDDHGKSSGQSSRT